MVEAAAGVNGIPKRSRLWYSLWIVLVIGAGLLWRSPLFHLPPSIAKYGGSALWALLVFLLCGWLLPRTATTRLALLAITIACAVEVSQLYHAPWVDQIRRTRLGALVLGSVFNWPDIPAYALGVITGVFAERTVRLARGKRSGKARPWPISN